MINPLYVTKKRKPIPLGQIGDLGPQRVGLELGPKEGTFCCIRIIKRYKLGTATQQLLEFVVGREFAPVKQYKLDRIRHLLQQIGGLIHIGDINGMPALEFRVG